MGAIRVWQSVSRPTDRILLDNENFNWFYDILVNSSYFRLKICIYVAMNVKNIIYKASFGRTCSKHNPRANNISVSHLPGDDCIWLVINLSSGTCTKYEWFFLTINLVQIFLKLPSQAKGDGKKGWLSMDIGQTRSEESEKSDHVTIR